LNTTLSSAAIRGVVALSLLAAGTAALAQTAAASAPRPGGYSGLGAGSVPPEVLARFRPAALPESISQRVQSLLDLRAPGAGVLSPDGKRLFFTWRVTGVDQVWRLDGPSSFPQQLTGGEDRTTVQAVSPDSRWVALERDRKGEENPGVYLQGADGGPLREVQHKRGVQTEFQGFSRDGRALYYVANDVRPDSYALYRHDIASGRNERLLDAQGFWRVGEVGPGGKLLMVKVPGSQAREWFLFDEATRQLAPVIGQGETEIYNVAFGARDGEYFVATPKLAGVNRLYRLRTGGELQPLAAGGASSQWEVESFKLDEARERLYVSVNEAGYTRSKAYDARTGKPLALPWPAGAEHELIGSTTPNGRWLVLGVGLPDRPRESFVWDWQTRRLTRWVVPSVPELDSKGFVAAKLESYPARDGTQIPMFVRRSAQCAAAATPCPVIVHFHGGPEAQTRPGFSPVWQLFIDAGFVVAEPNVRGSSGYGKAWLDADNGPKRLQVVTDIEDAALHIRRAWAKGGAAPKVGVYGGSYGGYSVLYAMTRFAGAYDAGVSNVGIANLLTFLENTAPYRRALRITEYGDPVKDREALIQLSPTTHVAQLKAPLLIVQGANDPRVPVGESLLMHEAAASRGVPVELMIFADEGHGASSRGNQALQFGHTLRFFQQHLKASGPSLATSGKAE
jgi:dipeptidyl aminopeptidase/acylaminoacyl peptidase